MCPCLEARKPNYWPERPVYMSPLPRKHLPWAPFSGLWQMLKMRKALESNSETLPTMKSFLKLSEEERDVATRLMVALLHILPGQWSALFHIFCGWKLSECMCLYSSLIWVAWPPHFCKQTILYRTSRASPSYLTFGCTVYVLKHLCLTLYLVTAEHRRQGTGNKLQTTWLPDIWQMAVPVQ